MKLIQNFNKMVDGMDNHSEQLKYQMICYVVFGILIIHMILYALIGIQPLIVLSILAMVVLLCAYQLTQIYKFFACTLLVYSLVFVYELVVSLFIGWNYGFTYYIFALIPILFNSIFTNSKIRHKITTPLVVASISLIAFLAVRYISAYVGLLWGSLETKYNNILFTINCVICYTVIVSFCILYISEMQSTQRNWKRQTEKLRDLVNLDPLTSLLNRRSMLGYMKDALLLHIKDNKDYCVILCDIDDFKRINDSYGHECGDLILIQVADKIRSQLNEQCHVCRWGGEELLILAPYSIEECRIRIEQLRKSLEIHEFLYRNNKISITMTFGVKAFEKNIELNQLIRMADDNMYRGKHQGKNCVID